MTCGLEPGAYARPASVTMRRASVIGVVTRPPSRRRGLTAGSGTHRPQGSQSYLLVRCCPEGHDPIDRPSTAVPQLPQATNRLHPPQHLVDQLLFALADLVSRVQGGSNVDRTVRSLSSDARGDVEGSDLVDEARRVVTLIGPDRAAQRCARLQHPRCRLTFRRARRRCHADVSPEAVPLVEECMAPIGQGRGAPLALPIQSRLRVCRGLVRVVAPAFIVDVDRGMNVLQARPSVRLQQAAPAESTNAACQVEALQPGRYRTKM